MRPRRRSGLRAAITRGPTPEFRVASGRMAASARVATPEAESREGPSPSPDASPQLRPVAVSRAWPLSFDVRGVENLAAGARQISLVVSSSGVELECRAQRAIQAYVRFRPGGRVHPPALIRLGPVAFTLEAAEIRGGCDLALFSVHGVVFGKIRVRPS